MLPTLNRTTKHYGQSPWAPVSVRLNRPFLRYKDRAGSVGWLENQVTCSSAARRDEECLVRMDAYTITSDVVEIILPHADDVEITATSSNIVNLPCWATSPWRTM